VTAHGIEMRPARTQDRAGYFGGIFQFLEKRTLMTRQRDIGRRDSVVLHAEELGLLVVALAVKRGSEG